MKDSSTTDEAATEEKATSLVFLYSVCHFFHEAVRAILRSLGIETADAAADQDDNIPDKKNTQSDCASEDSSGSQSNPSKDADEDELACPLPADLADPSTDQIPDSAAKFAIRASKRPPITKGPPGQINRSM